jgi:type IV secretory pathway TrbL component
LAKTKKCYLSRDFGIIKVYKNYLRPKSKELTQVIEYLYLSILFVPLLWFVVALLILVWAYRDAESRGMNGALWAIIIFFLSVLGLLLYLIVRSPQKDTNLIKNVSRVCPKCGQVLNEEAKFCPRCGKGLE